MKDGEILMIKWADSMNYTGWHNDEDVKKIVNKREPHLVTVGQYVESESDDEYVALAQSWNHRNVTKSNIMKILRAQIISYDKLENKEVKKIPVMAIIALFVASTSLYLSLFPTDNLVNRVAVKLFDSYELEIIN